VEDKPTTSVGTVEAADPVPGTSTGNPSGSDSKKKNRCQLCRKKVGLTGKRWNNSSFLNKIFLYHKQSTEF